METAALKYSAGAGVTGRLHHGLFGRSDYNISGKAFGSIVIVGLDLVEGTKVAVPTLTVGGRTVPATGVTVTVRNGAMVITDPSAQLLLISEPSWSLVWGSQEEPSAEAQRTAQPSEATRVASE